MLASIGKWQVVAWPWLGGQSALTSRTWHSSQAAAKWKLPSSFTETESYGPLYNFRLPSNSDSRGPRTLACTPNGKRKAVLHYRESTRHEREHSPGCQEVPGIKIIWQVWYPLEKRLARMNRTTEQGTWHTFHRLTVI